MRIAINGVAVGMQPDSVNWEPPRTLGNDGQGAPIRSPYWSCRLGFSRLSVVQFQLWEEVWTDGGLHDITLPQPSTGLLVSHQCYVQGFTPRLNTQDPCEAAAAGVDITLTRILVL